VWADEILIWLLRVVSIILLVLQVWAFVDCSVRPGPAFPAAGKLTKGKWLAITGIAMAFGALIVAIGSSYLASLSIIPLGLISIVASSVYLVDARPAIREITGR